MKRIHRAFKHLLLPHTGNDFEPLLLRTAGFVVALLAVLGLALGAVGYGLLLERSGILASVLPGVLIDLANADRIDSGLVSLAVNPKLVAAAQMKADDMATKGYFAHTAPGGTTPWHWFSQAGYLFVYAGENLAVDFSDSVAVNAAWMNSPTHRANILNQHYTEIGIATAQGSYEGRPTTFVVEEFASPAVSAEAATNPEAVPEIPQTPSTEPPAPLAREQEVVPVPVSAPAVAGAPAVSGAETFVAVKSATPVAEAPAASLSAPAAASSLASFGERILLSPSTLLRYAYFGIGLLLAAALIGVWAVEHPKRRSHFSKIALLFAVIAALYALLVFGAFFSPAIL